MCLCGEPPVEETVPGQPSRIDHRPYSNTPHHLHRNTEHGGSCSVHHLQGLMTLAVPSKVKGDI